jgi:hypothetical protein
MVEGTAAIPHSEAVVRSTWPGARRYRPGQVNCRANLVACGQELHTNTDSPTPCRGGHKACRGKRRHKQHREAILLHRVIQQPLHRRHGVNRLIRVHPQRLGACRLRQHARVDRRARHDVDDQIRVMRVRDEDLRLRIAARALYLASRTTPTTWRSVGPPW